MLIGEVAKMAHLSKDGVRHYEELGLIKSTPRTAGGRIYRDYDVSVLETIEQVRSAQQLGFTLKEIGPLLEAHRAGPMSQAQTVEFLEQRLVVIREKLEALKAVETFISRKLEKYRAPPAVPQRAAETAPTPMTPRARQVRKAAMAEVFLANPLNRGRQAG